MNNQILNFIDEIIELDIDNPNDIFELLSNEAKALEIKGYFYVERKMNELCEELKEIEDIKKEKFLKNIVNLYPLSKKLIVTLNEYNITIGKKTVVGVLANATYIDSYYGVLFDSINSLKDISNGNKAVQDLEDKINSLEDDIKEYRIKIEKIKADDKGGEVKEKKKERDRLKKELEDLKKDQNIQSLEKDIEEFNRKIKKLRKENGEKCEERKKLSKQLKELSEMINESEEKKLIDQLISKWPEDEA